MVKYDKFYISYKYLRNVGKLDANFVLIGTISKIKLYEFAMIANDQFGVTYIQVWRAALRKYPKMVYF